MSQVLFFLGGGGGHQIKSFFWTDLKHWLSMEHLLKKMKHHNISQREYWQLTTQLFWTWVGLDRSYRIQIWGKFIKISQNKPIRENKNHLPDKIWMSPLVCFFLDTISRITIKLSEFPALTFSLSVIFWNPPPKKSKGSKFPLETQAKFTQQHLYPPCELFLSPLFMCSPSLIEENCTLLLLFFFFLVLKSTLPLLLVPSSSLFSSASCEYTTVLPS